MRYHSSPELPGGRRWPQAATIVLLALLAWLTAWLVIWLSCRAEGIPRQVLRPPTLHGTPSVRPRRCRESAPPIRD